jgi:hypothetical protein
MATTCKVWAMLMSRPQLSTTATSAGRSALAPGLLPRRAEILSGRGNGRSCRLPACVTVCGRSIQPAISSVRYDASAAGDPTRKRSAICNCAALNLGLPDRSFITFYPRRHQDKSWRSDHRTDRPAVPSIRRENRTQIVRQRGTVVRAWRAYHQGLSGL